MENNKKAPHLDPSRLRDQPQDPDPEVVNDSFGTVDLADSSGLDEDRETGDAKTLNQNNRED